jgi:hypothetical protein
MSDNIHEDMERRIEQLRQKVEAEEAQAKLRLSKDVTPGTAPAQTDNTLSLPSETPITVHPKDSIETLPKVEAEPIEPPRPPEGWRPGGPETR